MISSIEAPSTFPGSASPARANNQRLRLISVWKVSTSVWSAASRSMG
jgi:hypothetical protein